MRLDKISNEANVDRKEDWASAMFQNSIFSFISNSTQQIVEYKCKTVGGNTC